MQPKTWRYKLAYSFFGLFFAITLWRTGAGLGNWLWNDAFAFGDDAPSVSVEQTPTHETAGYSWPH